MKQFDPIQYIRATYKQYMLRIDRRKYPEIIEHLDKQPNKSAYMRTLINKDLNHGEEKKRI